MKRISITSLFFFVFSVAATLHAQEKEDSLTAPVQDSLTTRPGFFKRLIHYFEEANVDKSTEKFDISFIGGPSYSRDTKLGIGMVASGLYRIDKSDTSLPPSDVSIFSNITTSGFFAIGIDNHTIFPHDDFRIDATTYFSYMPTQYYGIGYENGRRDIYTEFDQYSLSLEAAFLKKIAENFYAGPRITAKNRKGKHFEDEDMIPNEPLSNTMIGPGILVSYDSRDFAPNPSKGLYLLYQQDFYMKSLGSTNSYNSITAAIRAYKEIWKGGILAYDLNGEFNNGRVPWNLLSKLGGARQMRGYYRGQYRDKKQINTQLELRQKIAKRQGIAIWGGAGTVFDSFKNLKLKHTLPTYGIGYRWEFKHRVNIRFDYGIGKGQTGFYFNINEAF